MLFYYPSALEVDAKPLLEAAWKLGKKVALPRTQSETKVLIPIVVRDLDALEKGPHGIYEPAHAEADVLPLAQIDLIVVPGVAFDKWGNRLGRGLGFYDRFLARLGARTTKIGLAFDIQMVELVPTVDEQDVPLDLVISN